MWSIYKKMRNNLTQLNNVTKILLIILVVAVSYFLIFIILKPFSAPKDMMGMMEQLSGGLNTTNLFSLILALIIGIVISFYLFKQNEKDKEKDKEFNIIKKALSEDERKILNEIKKAGEITQDSLRFRLNWSKAKISTILTNLDKRGLIQRERTGKTYKVYLEKG